MSNVVINPCLGQKTGQVDAATPAPGQLLQRVTAKTQKVVVIHDVRWTPDLMLVEKKTGQHGAPPYV
jgi:hypothetical protein